MGRLFDGEDKDTFGTGGFEAAYYLPETFLVKYGVN